MTLTPFKCTFTLTQFALMTDRENEYPIGLGVETIQRDIARSTPRYHQFPQTAFRNAAHQGMAGQHCNGLRENAARFNRRVQIGCR